jgi:hypothetical protein
MPSPRCGKPLSPRTSAGLTASDSVCSAGSVMARHKNFRIAGGKHCVGGALRSQLESGVEVDAGGACLSRGRPTRSMPARHACAVLTWACQAVPRARRRASWRWITSVTISGIKVGSVRSASACIVRGRSSLCRIRLKWYSAEYLFPREIEAADGAGVREERRRWLCEAAFFGRKGHPPPSN